MSNEDRIQKLLLRWEEGREESQDLPVEELCRERPELAPALAERIAALKGMAWMNRPDSIPKGADGEGEGASFAAPTTPDWLAAGSEPIRGYRLVKKLGSGGFGQVWEAADPRGRPVAVKIVPTAVAGRQGNDKAVIELDGLERIMGISSPYKLFIERCELVGGNLVIVSDLADGSLDDFMRTMRRQGDDSQVVAACLEHLEGVATLLDLLNLDYGLMHGDIKPTNLLMNGGVCQVGDFGTVARLSHSRPAPSAVLLSLPSEDGSPARQTEWFGSLRDVSRRKVWKRGATLFTAAGAFSPMYAPPEALQGSFSRSFDQYSLAVTFCELATGQMPFSEAGESVERRPGGAITLDLLPVRLRPPLLRALSLQPEDRFPSCQAFIQELSSAANAQHH